MTHKIYSLTIEADNLKDYIYRIKAAAMDVQGFEAGIIARSSEGEPEKKKPTTSSTTASTKPKVKEIVEEFVDETKEEEFNLDGEGVTIAQIEAKLRELNNVCGREWVTKITNGCKVKNVNDIPKKHFDQVLKQCNTWITEKKGEIEVANLKKSEPEFDSEVSDSLFDDEPAESEGADVEIEVLRAVAKVANEDYKKGFKAILEPYGIKTMKGFSGLKQGERNTIFAKLNDLVGEE